MPIQIPPFVQYQAPMPPLRGLWNTPPVEGDRYVNAEIDWLNSPPGNAVQFQLSGNSPVALSQIVALAVNNANCGADVQFLFPDSGSNLTVAAKASGIFPVFTNALMFYAIATNAILGDKTLFHCFNSMPPPVPIPPSVSQNSARVTGEPLTEGSLTIIPPPISGTLNTMSISLYLQGTGAVQLSLTDGNGSVIWAGYYTVAAGEAPLNIPIQLSGLSVRFVNGVYLGTDTDTSGGIDVNLFYSQP